MVACQAENNVPVVGKAQAAYGRQLHWLRIERWAEGPAEHPVIVHCADATAAFAWAREVPEGAKTLAAKFWPGPLTLVLKRSQKAGDFITGGQDTIVVGKFEMPSRAYLARFNFRGADQQKPVGQLSGGERGRLHLAKTLVSGANVLLLDEPSNDLDVETLRALEEALLEFAGSVLVISHDRWFLDRIATHILAFEGDSQAVFFSGNYQEYEADKKKRLGEEAARPHRIRYKPLAK